MLACFATEKKSQTIPVMIVTQPEFAAWLELQSAIIRNWLQATQFRYDAGNISIVPNDQGQILCVICCVDKLENFWGVGQLPLQLPQGVYELQLDEVNYNSFAIAWGLGAYQFTRYKKPLREAAQLYLPATCVTEVTTIVESIYLVRDLVNTPADDMGPSQLSSAAASLAKEHGAGFTEIVGEDLLAKNYASIYTVGRACDDAPRLLDIRWGNPAHPRVTLVGKGVCFDTGGLDIKGSSHMLLMKKDMAGGAHVLGLARMIMQAKLPVCLRVLIPVVENSVSGNAYRPGDVIKSRQGLTIEIGNTDAEGRVVLADALTEAASENPALLIDISTLTGAARVALGTELPALFANNDQVAVDVINHGTKNNDPMWRMPLFALYRDSLNSQIADINNNSTDYYGGAITAALFLKEFVPDSIPWMHFDLMAWNLRARPGRPIGGEAMGLRALFSYLQERFK